MLSINQARIINYGSSKNVIDKREEVGIIDLEIKKSVENITTRYYLTIPRFYKTTESNDNNEIIKKIDINGFPVFYKEEPKKFQYNFRRGDLCEIFMNSEDAIPFDEFCIILNIEYNMNEIKIELEDFSYYLKGKTDISFRHEKGKGDPKFDNLLEFIAQEINRKTSEIKQFLPIFPNLKFNNTEIETETLAVGNYSFGVKQKMNVAQIIKEMVKKYNIWFKWEVKKQGADFIITPKIYRLYENETDLKHTFSFRYIRKKKEDDIDMYGILEYDLNYFTNNDLIIELNAKNYLQDNTVQEFTYIYPEGSIGSVDRSIDVVMANIETKEEFEKLVKLRAEESTYFGWTGDLEIHGPLPYSDLEFVNSGEVCKIINAKYFDKSENFINDDVYDEKKELYKIEEVVINFSESGIRQNITLANRIVI